MATYEAGFDVMAQCTGGTLTLSIPKGGRRGQPRAVYKYGRGWCSAVDVPEIMQRLFQQFFDRRGCNTCCTVVDVPVPCSDVQKTSRGALGSTVNTCTASVSWGFFRKNFFCVMVFSGSEVDSRPALLVSSFYAERRGAHSRSFGCFPCRFTWKFGHCFTSPRTWRSLARCLYIAVEKFCTLCQTRVVLGSPGVSLPGDLASISLGDCRCYDRCGVIIHTHQVVSETTTTSCLTQGCPFLCVNCCQTSAVDMSDVERASGAARRRRERRLRSWLKHERQTVRMVLAETFHHFSAPFPPKFKEEWVGTRSTTPYGDRTRQGPGRPRTARRRPVWLGIRRSSRCSMRKTPCGVRGRPVWSSRRGRKSESSGTPWSSLPTLLQWYRSSTYQCRRWWTSWWTSLRSPSMSSQCPRSRRTPSCTVRFLSRSWRNSWWKCRLV